jgi:hypothetical protein
MRILALLLLLANIIFFAWQQQHLPWLPVQPENIAEKPQAVKIDPSDANLLPLQMLSEYNPTPEELAALEAAPRRLREAHPTTPTTVAATETETTNIDLGLGKIFTRIAERATETQAVVIPPDETQNNTEISTNELIASEEPFSPIEPTENQSVSEPNSQQIVATGESSDESDESNPDNELRVASAENTGQVLIPPPPPEIQSTPKKLEQKQTITPTTTPKTVTPVTPVTPVPPKSATPSAVAVKTSPSVTSSTGTSICYEIGPYVQSSSAKNAAQWFNQRQTNSAKISQRATPILENTWVYLPPFANRQAAEQAQKRLQQQGIQDHYINKDHSISLGVFRDPLGVQRRLLELNSKGINNVKTQPRHRGSETRHWLHVKLPRSQQNLIGQFDRTVNSPEVKTTSCN